MAVGPIDSAVQDRSRKSPTWSARATLADVVSRRSAPSRWANAGTSAENSPVTLQYQYQYQYDYGIRQGKPALVFA
jgi:hypothetical protein